MRTIGSSPTRTFLATFRDMLRDETFRVAVSLLAAMIVTATIFYAIVEGWSILDSLYFSIIAATTVGFGDFAPQTDLGKLYTIIYLLVTVGLLVLVLGRLAGGMIAHQIETSGTSGAQGTPSDAEPAPPDSTSDPRDSGGS